MSKYLLASWLLLLLCCEYPADELGPAFGGQNSIYPGYLAYIISYMKW